MAKQNGFDFMFDSRWYTLQGAETMMHGTKDDVATMRAEYTRMRDVAVKRIKRLEKQFPESKAYQRWVDPKTGQVKMPEKLRDMDKRNLAKAFSELAKFVGAKGSTVSGQKEIKKKTIQAWQKQGLNLNGRNYDRAIKILEELRKRKLVYGSDKVVELADAMMTLDDQQVDDILSRIESVFNNLDEVVQDLALMDEVNGMEFDDIISELE